MIPSGLALHEVGAGIRQLFLDGEFPEAIATAIREAYRELSRRSGVEAVAVAVRSSATAEDLPDASFAGQQETFLNVRGERELMDVLEDNEILELGRWAAIRRAPLRPAHGHGMG